jgi:predicted porin
MEILALQHFGDYKMRKTQVALAALALVASTAVMAQSVNMYGVIDVGARNDGNSKSSFAGLGSWAGNIAGISVSEDLDNGMKLGANFELGYNLGSGENGQNGGVSSTNTFFNRKSNVTLSGDFGKVTAGLQISPFIVAMIGGSAIANNQSFYVQALSLAGDGIAGGSSSSTTQTSTASPIAGGFFIPNAVTYSTNSINGLTLTAMSQVGGSARDVNGNSNNSYVAWSASYAASEAVTLNVGGQKRDGVYGTTTSAGNYSSITASGTYKLSDDTTLGFGWINHENNTSATASTKLGVTYGAVTHKLNDTVTLSGGYAKNDATTAGSIMNFGVQYKLSGNSYAYATAGIAGDTTVSTIYGGAAAKGANTTTRGYAVGVVKNF